MNEQIVYRKSEIAKILNETPRTIQFWVDYPLVPPDRSKPGKTKSPFLFSESALLEFGMLKILKDSCRVNLDRIKEILGILREGRCKQKGRDVVFDDFYSNTDWGAKKELLAVFQVVNPVEFLIMKKNKYGTYEIPQVFFSTRVNDLREFRLLMLGNVKRDAEKLLREKK